MPSQIIEAVIEHPRGSFIKRRPDGSIDLISPLPCPYNYGSVPGTTGGDGDPVDVIVLGRRLRSGTRVRLPVVAEVRFIDEDARDHKLVLGDHALTGTEELGLVVFFRAYTLFKRLVARLRGRAGAIDFLGIERQR
jgi:inorganic pyrophosphatase